MALRRHLRSFLATYGLPLVALAVTGLVNWLYLQLPALEAVGIGQAAALGLLNSALVGAAGMLDLDAKSPSYTATGSRKVYEAAIIDLKDQVTALQEERAHSWRKPGKAKPPMG